jgi:hypothetical protein
MANRAVWLHQTTGRRREKSGRPEARLRMFVVLESGSLSQLRETA